MGKNGLTFSELFKRQGEHGIARIATAYASTGCFDTMEAIAAREGVSSACVSKCVKYAIENALISHQMCSSIIKKAHNAQVRHIDREERESPSDRYYRKLMATRREYLKSMRDERVNQVVEYYINNSQWDIGRVASSMGYSIGEVNLIMKVAIICGIATRDQVEQVKKISLSKARSSADSARTRKLLNEYVALREEYQLKCTRLRHICEQIATYAEWANEDVSIESLEEQKKTLEKELKEIEQLL
jgi:hypothetical protein